MFQEGVMTRILLMGAALAVAGCASGTEHEIRTDRSAQLASLLEGREAGMPVSCINLRDLRGNRSAGDAIVFEGTGGTLYVNRPAGGCPALDFGRTLVVRSSTGRLCAGDIARVIDPVSRTEFGSCGLTEFMPYRRASD
jgi:hypothetical protein